MKKIWKWQKIRQLPTNIPQSQVFIFIIYFCFQVPDLVHTRKAQKLVYTIKALLPFNVYVAAAACREMFGIWSDWSSGVAARTLERGTVHIQIDIYSDTCSQLMPNKTDNVTFWSLLFWAFLFSSALQVSTGALQTGENRLWWTSSSSSYVEGTLEQFTSAYKYKSSLILKNIKTKKVRFFPSNSQSVQENKVFKCCIIFLFANASSFLRLLTPMMLEVVTLDTRCATG